MLGDLLPQPVAVLHQVQPQHEPLRRQARQAIQLWRRDRLTSSSRRPPQPSPAAAIGALRATAYSEPPDILDTYVARIFPGQPVGEKPPPTAKNISRQLLSGSDWQSCMRRTYPRASMRDCINQHDRRQLALSASQPADRTPNTVVILGGLCRSGLVCD